MHVWKTIAIAAVVALCGTALFASTVEEHERDPLVGSVLTVLEFLLEFLDPF